MDGIDIAAHAVAATGIHNVGAGTIAARGMSLVSTALVFADASNQLLTNTTALLCWDNTNKRIGVGTATPTTPLSILNSSIIDGGAGILLGYSSDYYHTFNAHFSASAASNYLSFIINSGTGTRAEGVRMHGDGSLWIANNCSALSFTDRTPFYDGNALLELKMIKGDIDGKIVHESLPEFACKEEGRDLGAMISILTKAVLQLTEKVEKLEQEIKK